MTSVAIDSRLPGAEHLVVVLLLDSDASLILYLGQLGCSLFVHAVLELATHRPVTLTHLTQDVRLMALLLVCDTHSFLLVCPILSLHFGVDLHLIVVSEPLLLALKSLPEKDVLLTILIHVLEQVDPGLVFTAPLLLPSIPLLVVLDLSQMVDHLFVGGLVVLRLLIVSLELLDLPTARHALFLLDLFDRTLTLQRSLQEQLIPVKFLLVGLLSELLFSCIVCNEFKITLAIEHELLFVVPLLFLLLNGPLLSEHGLLLLHQLLVLLTLRLASVLLPVQHLHRVPNLLLLLLGLANLPLELLLSI